MSTYAMERHHGHGHAAGVAYRIALWRTPFGLVLPAEDPSERWAGLRFEECVWRDGRHIGEVFGWLGLPGVA